MGYLIDGNNLIHAVPELREAFLEDSPEAGKRALLNLLLPWAEALRCKVTVVFDGGDGRRRRETSRFWVHEEPFADRALIALMQRGPWKVVSSDGEVRAEALRMGWKALHVRDFALELLPPSSMEDEKPPPPSSRAEINAWRRYFAEFAEDFEDLEFLEGREPRFS